MFLLFSTEGDTLEIVYSEAHRYAREDKTYKHMINILIIARGDERWQDYSMSFQFQYYLKH